jgi:hypothetical protein
MAEKLICELRLVKNPEGIWFETSYPEEGKRTESSRKFCDLHTMHLPWHRIKDRSRRRMRKSLDFLEGLYNDLYGNPEK